ncbi:MAG: T9SS type A sorting domain-containing protein [Muribaculaceae bacterium]|nr:T9SS type A sorting domain-containing protein [Muribaculaceae bacterium]
MKKTILLTMCFGALIANAGTVIDSQPELEKIFAQGPYDFAGLPDDGGGDLWFADGWNVPVIAADFNGDGYKDVIVSGNVSFGEVSNASPTNVLYLGDGNGRFNVYQLPNTGAYYLGTAAYIKLDKAKTVVATTGSVTNASWWEPGYNTGLKSMWKTSLHSLTFDAEGNPKWTLIKELEDGCCGAGQGLNLCDLDNDGNYDVLISGAIGLPDSADEIMSEYGSSTQVVYWGNGNDEFTRTTHIENGMAPMAEGNAIVADVNNDGWLDVVSCTAKSGKCYNDAGNTDLKGDGSGVFVSINNKNRTFTAKTVVESVKNNGLFFTAEGARVTVGDFNNDGAIDIYWLNNDQVTANPWIYRGGLMLNDGNGNFSAYDKDLNGNEITPLGGERATPVVADFNQDGNLDLWWNSWIPTSDIDDESKRNDLCALVGILRLGDGRGGFSTSVFKGEKGADQQPVMEGYYNRWCSLKCPVYAVADFNNDGVPDIVATSGDAHNGDYKGLSYVVGTTTYSDNAVKLPSDNSIGDFSGIEDTSLKCNASVIYTCGELAVSGLEGETVEIYSISGVKVGEFVAKANYHVQAINLTSGLYVVVANGYSQKIIAQ